MTRRSCHQNHLNNRYLQRWSRKGSLLTSRGCDACKVFLVFTDQLSKKIGVHKRGSELKENVFKYLGVLPVDSSEFCDTGKLEIL